jgi:alkylhydroperoxidase family enzyme
VSGPTSPRLPPLPPEQWDDDVRGALAAAFTDEGAARLLGTGRDAIPMPNVLATLMHHPTLAGPFLVYNNVLLRSPTLDARLRELMILRVAWRTGSTYEWAQHLRIAAGVGITAEEIEAVAHGTDAVAWPALETVVLTAVDELVDGYRIADDTWSRLAEQLDERQLVELVFVVGTYTGLAMAFNSFDLELDADLPTTPAPPRIDIEE